MRNIQQKGNLIMELQDLIQMAEQGDVEAQYKLGCLYRSKQYLHYKAAFHWLLKAAEQRYASAQNAAGEMLRSGKKIQRNCKTAFYWFLRAAEQGESQAFFNLSESYFGGEGCKRDYEQSAYWLQKAAEADPYNSDAQYRLGIHYFFGYGVECDYDKAEEYFIKAAEQSCNYIGYIAMLMTPISQRKPLSGK